MTFLIRKHLKVDERLLQKFEGGKIILKPECSEKCRLLLKCGLIKDKCNRKVAITERERELMLISYY